MSCDENHEARARDREDRSARKTSAKSLPILGQRPAPGKTYWRSLEERDRGIAFSATANEFKPGDGILEGVSRRGFMQMLGVSTAVTTLGAACRKPNERIVPFVRRPEEITPGGRATSHVRVVGAAAVPCIVLAREPLSL